MKNIRTLFNINISTYILILTFFATGLFKNIILIYIIIVFHELGHIFIIKFLKYKIISIDIYPSGGITKIEKRINSNIYHELIISLFGIIFQIILFFIFFYLFKSSIISKHTYAMFKNYNKTIIIFNLLPIIPLDGYNFLRSIIELFYPYKKAFYLSFIISLIFIITFTTYNEIYSLNNYLIISFLIYKIITTLKDFKFSYFKFQLERHMLDLKLHKIKYEKKPNLSLLKKDTYHFFKENGTFISEKKLLNAKFEK